jgi:hypothetical protein
MVITIIELVADLGFWTINKVYYIGKWMVYGIQEDIQDRYIREQKEIIEMYKRQIDQLIERQILTEEL